MLRRVQTDEYAVLRLIVHCWRSSHHGAEYCKCWHPVQHVPAHAFQQFLTI